MAIGIPNGDSPLEARFSAGKIHGSWRDKCELAGAQPAFGITDVGRNKICLPIEQVAGSRISGIRTSVTRQDIFEKFDARSRGCPQSRDSKTYPKDVVQVFLLDPIVLTFAGLLQSECVSIESETRLCVADHDCGVVNAKK